MGCVCEGIDVFAHVALNYLDMTLLEMTRWVVRVFKCLVVSSVRVDVLLGGKDGLA